MRLDITKSSFNFAPAILAYVKMKKVTVLFLLIVMLFASSHATVAFHYCGGDLRSVRLGGAEEVSSCGEKEHHRSGHSETAIQQTPCCSDRYQEIDTEDYTKTQQMVPAGNDKDFHPATFASHPVFGSGDLFEADSFQCAFPPPGSFTPSGIDLLLSICILRI